MDEVPLLPGLLIGVYNHSNDPRPSHLIYIDLRYVEIDLAGGPVESYVPPTLRQQYGQDYECIERDYKLPFRLI